ncbi:MAG: glycosyltransferase family 39 protein, partial [Acidobacteria bacterium]|nr:glycosyltransferase family 39 protein [Acidobacteriota bacterium]
MMRRPFLLFAIAFALRLIYVEQISDAPYFDVPLIDGANYFRLAEAIAAGDLLGGRQAFWQPPLYPYFLAALIKTFGPKMGAILAVQAAVGALSCLLVYFIGRRVFGEGAAIVASLILAAYGPLIHFDGQPLIPVLHIVLVLGGLLLILNGAGIPEAGPAPKRAWGWAGVLWGLAAIATPNVLLAVPPVALWGLQRRHVAARRPHEPGAAAVALFLLWVAAPIAVVAARNVTVAREAILISGNAGINFYIGNNPDYERTIRIRPGGEFERLAQEPENLGIVSASGRSRYFAGRAFQFIRDYPGQALRLYGRKALDLIAGREIPRNQDQYAYRRYSSLLSILLWRGVISFPLGLLAPLALAGALSGRRDPPGAGVQGAPRSGRALLLLYAAAYAVSNLAFFPTDRYRLPLVPVLALFAGSLLASPRAVWKRPAVLGALVVGLVIFNLDAFRAGEAYPEEEALNRAYAFRTKGRLAEAAEEYRRAIALNPRRLDPHNALAAMAAREGRREDAVRHYRDLLALAPDFAEIRRNLGEAYTALGQREEARREWQIAVRLAPGDGLALASLCLSYLDEGLAPVAEPYCA